MISRSLVWNLTVCESFLWPTMLFMLYRTVVFFDHCKKKSVLLTLKERIKDLTSDYRKFWMLFVSVGLTVVTSCFCLFVFSPKPWILWASWQRQCLWQWRSCTVALTPPPSPEGSMSLWCDSPMDHSSVPPFTFALASWGCCDLRRRLYVFPVLFDSLLFIIHRYIFIVIHGFRWTLK